MRSFSLLMIGTSVEVKGPFMHMYVYKHFFDAQANKATTCNSNP